MAAERLPFPRAVLARGTVLLIAVLAIALPAIGPAAAQVEFRLSRIASFIPDMPQKKEMNRAYRHEIEVLRKDLSPSTDPAYSPVCSTTAAAPRAYAAAKPTISESESSSRKKVATEAPVSA